MIVRALQTVARVCAAVADALLSSDFDEFADIDVTNCGVRNDFDDVTICVYREDDVVIIEAEADGGAQVVRFGVSPEYAQKLSECVAEAAAASSGDV